MSDYLMFRLGKEVFGIDISSVVEIINPKEVHQVPQSSEYILGVITIRGEVVPLIDMRIRLGLTPEPEKERAVLIRSSIEKLGLVVDNVMDIASIDDDDIVSSPTLSRGLPSEYLLGIATINEQVVMLLDMEVLLTSEEKIKLQASREAGEAQE